MTPGINLSVYSQQLESSHIMIILPYQVWGSSRQLMWSHSIAPHRLPQTVRLPVFSAVWWSGAQSPTDPPCCRTDHRSVEPPSAHTGKLVKRNGKQTGSASTPACLRLPFYMARPDTHTAHQAVWSNIPPTPSVLGRIWSLTHRSDHYPVFGACNVSPHLGVKLEKKKTFWWYPKRNYNLTKT